LEEEQWNSPSLCTGWTVRDVVAHLCAIASLHAPRLLLGLAKSRLSFADFANTEIQKHLHCTFSISASSRDALACGNAQHLTALHQRFVSQGASFPNAGPARAFAVISSRPSLGNGAELRQ
jgi:Mycothiol maleylpyruvate isomerase N-terminal domain